jgi:hypothetical protein
LSKIQIKKSEYILGLRVLERLLPLMIAGAETLPDDAVITTEMLMPRTLEELDAKVAKEREEVG